MIEVIEKNDVPLSLTELRAFWGFKTMLLIGIAGGSGSGKTTFAKKVVAHSAATRAASKRSIKEGSDIILLHQDSYYLPKIPDHICPNGEPNFDHPEAFDWPLLKNHLQKLKAGESVKTPVYDFQTNSRARQTESVGPCRAILIEGIYTLWDPEIRDLFDIRVFLSVDADIRFIRRLHRDVRERGRTLDSIIRQYYDTVRPMHREYLEPSRQFADIVVGEETDIASEVLAARINQILGDSIPTQKKKMK